MSTQSANFESIQTSACDICQAKSARLLYATYDRLHITDESFQIAECLGCGVRRTLPEMSAAELARYYPQEYWGGVPTARWIRSSQADKTAFVRACNLAGGRILDVGCGAGFFLSALVADSTTATTRPAWQVCGVEIGEDAAQAAKQLLATDDILTGTLLDAAFADASFDVVTFWSSLEHTNEPRTNLLEARRVLRPGGSLIVQVPNAASYQAAHFQGDWFALDAPRHRYHFTPTSLKRLLDDTGFALYRTTSHSRAHNAHALRQSLKARLWRRSPLHRAAFLVSLPFLKPLDFLLSSAERGATMTVAALARG